MHRPESLERRDATARITSAYNGDRIWPTSDFTGVQIPMLFVALTLLISVPVWTHPLPPLSDYVNHLARMHVIATVRSNADLARF